MGVVEGAGYAFAIGALQHATQEGGRLAALPTTASETAVKTRVVEQAEPLDVQAADVSIEVNDGGSTFLLRASGDRVRVTTAYDYRPVTSALFGGATFAVSAQAEFAVE